jgi:hypothetical protein
VTRPLASAAIAASLLLGGCASALREPPPLATTGEGAAPAAPADVDRLLAEAAAAFAHRPDPAAVDRARTLFLAAAAADESRVEALLGAAEAVAWLIEHEADAGRRSALASEGVELGQWCQRRAPAEVACRYRLALALGLQARERPRTSADGLERMFALLTEVAATDPGLDHAGPHRVAALVLLRAPGWPFGPGDPEEGLAAARQAVEVDAAYPPNQLVLGEALAATGASDEGRAAWQHAHALAVARSAEGDPDAAAWAEEAAEALAAVRVKSDG